MNTIAKIVSGFLLGVILFQFVTYSCEKRKWRKDEITLNAIIDSCYQKRADTITKVITLKQIDTIRLKPETVTITDSIRIKDTVLYTHEYTGKYEQDFITVRWRAKILGELKSLEILPYSFLRYPQVTISKTVALPARECEPVRVSRERSHLYFTAGYMHPVLFQGGLMYIRKEGWGLSAGLTVTGEQLYYGGGLIIRLK